MATPAQEARPIEPPARWDVLGRAAGLFFQTPFKGTISIIGGLAVWEFFSRIVVNNALFLAAPTQIIAAIFHLAEDGELEHHMAISGLEFIIGYAIASVLGIALGVGLLVGYLYGRRK